jgi:hypothetical protein
MTTPAEHRWYTPADCSALVLGVQHGRRYCAPCPACQSSRTDALSITEGTDRDGHPMTLLHCFAHQCPIEDICAAMGIEVRNLFAIHPDYARATRNAPRARSPRIDRLKSMQEPTPDELAQILLEEMIVSDPPFIQECLPARAKMWALAHASPTRKEALTQCLYLAKLRPSQFWADLARDMEGSNGANPKTV